jgi:hypothetical protein
VIHLSMWHGTKRPDNSAVDYVCTFPEYADKWTLTLDTDGAKQPD